MTMLPNIGEKKCRTECTQQTTTRDFMCSVSEFTSSTALIHVNSPDYVNTFGVSTRVYREITSFLHDDVPVKP